MAIVLKLSKPDGGSHWGFRLVGGVEFNEPLVVVKVNEKSYAENAGMMVGDVVVRINDTPTAGLTHTSVHDLINASGYEFVMAIRRGLFSDIPVPSEDNSEVEDILRKSLAQHINDVGKDQEIGPSPATAENLAGQEQLIYNTQSVGQEKLRRPKKLSTFLVKPKNLKPVCKKVEEERKILGEPYRVKIIKQPKRDPKDVLNHSVKKVQFEPQVTEVEISRETSIADSTESLELVEPIMELDISVEATEETTIEICDADDEIDENETPDENNNSTIQLNQSPQPILQASPIDIHFDPVICESSLSLEQQLAAVQKQLLALAQLPSAIQITLEAVTQQLNKIVLEKSIQAEDAEKGDKGLGYSDLMNGFEDTIDDLVEDNISVSENAEGDITETETEDQRNVEELEEDAVEQDEISVKEETEPEKEPGKPIVVDPYEGLTEEEKEAKIKEEQMLAKKEKREEERRKMDWTQRPIVLPGGRKWTDPEDATSKCHTPKMSDEKICKTIEDYSEVIVGKTKGSSIGTTYGRGEINRNPSTGIVVKRVNERERNIILLNRRSGFVTEMPGSRTASWCPAKCKANFINFLKYQPPPKNLDYLQKSEVYRLIHDMEPPVRGVGARAEKVLSEKDYYGDKGAP